MTDLKDVTAVPLAIKMAADIVHAAYGEIPDKREYREAMAEEIGCLAAHICLPSIRGCEEAENASLAAHLFPADDDDD